MKTRSPQFRRFTAAAAFVAAAAVSATPALASWNTDTWRPGRIVDVQVRVDGVAAPLYVSPQGDDRRYLQAYAGRNYSVVLRNTSGERIAVLLAVDGLNVVSGQRSNLSPSEQMYVLGPYESATIDGWRTSLDDVQRFVFVDEKRSYASRTGQANGDMGWIRVLSFREQRSWWGQRFRPTREKVADGRSDAPRAYNEDRAREGAPAPTAQALPEAPAPARGEAGALGRLQSEEKSTRGLEADRLQDAGPSFPGTGWGEHQRDHVELVAFTPERTATDRIVLRYEYASGLRALGILPDRDRLYDRDRGQLGFAKPPRW